MTKRTPWLVLLLTTALSGCIGPAIVDAAKHWDDYDLLAQRQVDADHFVAIVSVTHRRGEFDVLGSHGSRAVTRSVDVVLLSLEPTPGGLKATRLDTRSFASEQALMEWPNRLVADFDATNRHLQFTRIRDRVDARRSDDLSVDAAANTIRSRVHGQACAVPMPPRLGADKKAPGLTLSDDRAHALVDERYHDQMRAVLLDLCDAAAPRPEFVFPDRSQVGIAVGADGSPRLVRVTDDGPGGHFGLWRYEARLFPGPEVLAFESMNLGLGPDTRNAPPEFMVDAQARRFHWILVPPWDSGDRLIFFTHDFATGATTRHEAPFPGA